MIEIFIFAIVGIVFIILASPSMKGRGYRDIHKKDEYDSDRIAEEEQYRVRGRSRYNY